MTLGVRFEPVPIRYPAAACQTDLPNPIDRGQMRRNTDRERYPDTPAHRRSLAEYNTGAIGRTRPPLETTR